MRFTIVTFLTSTFLCAVSVSSPACDTCPHRSDEFLAPRLLMRANADLEIERLSEGVLKLLDLETSSAVKKEMLHLFKSGNLLDAVLTLYAESMDTRIMELAMTQFEDPLMARIMQAEREVLQETSDSALTLAMAFMASRNPSPTRLELISRIRHLTEYDQNAAKTAALLLSLQEILYGDESLLLNAPGTLPVQDTLMLPLSQRIAPIMLGYTYRQFMDEELRQYCAYLSAAMGRSLRQHYRVLLQVLRERMLAIRAVVEESLLVSMATKAETPQEAEKLYRYLDERSAASGRTMSSAAALQWAETLQTLGLYAEQARVMAEMIKVSK